MALQKLQFKPGVNRDQTNYSGEGGFYACDKIRFRSGFPQKIGGWLRYSFFTLIGVCRQMFNYVTSYSDNLLWIGTNKKVYVEVGGVLMNMTPYAYTKTTTATDNCIDVTINSNVVNINITSHGGTAGNYVQISGVVGTGIPKTIGGIPEAEFNGNFMIQSVVDANNFTIHVASQATSTVSNAGGTAITVGFEIPVGNEVTIYGYGWGVAAWGNNFWGAATTVPIVYLQRDWWFDNFDNDTVMNIREGSIYYWSYNGAFTNRPVLLSSISGATDVPSKAMQTLVSQNDKHLLAFGCIPYGSTDPNDYDPLLIRWASQDAPEFWRPGTDVVPSTGKLSSAGFLRVSRGSYIVRALPTRQEILVFTNSNLYSLQFTGTTDVFALQELADNISIMSCRACATANNVTYWMGQDKFYSYSGRVDTMPCTLRNHVFNNFNYDQNQQVICGTNEGWQEIWWFYPTANSSVNDAYVIYNYYEQAWYYGTINRTAWLDSSLRQYPQAVGGHYVYNHEYGVNDDTSPMNSYIETNDFDIGDGENLVLTKRIIPDVNFDGSTSANPQVLMTLKPRNFPGSNYKATNQPEVTRNATVPIDQYTDQVFIRTRARQMGFKIQSTELGVQWQLGAPRLDGKLDGKR